MSDLAYEGPVSSELSTRLKSYQHINENWGSAIAVDAAYMIPTLALFEVLPDLNQEQIDEISQRFSPELNWDWNQTPFHERYLTAIEEFDTHLYNQILEEPLIIYGFVKMMQRLSKIYDVRHHSDVIATTDIMNKERELQSLWQAIVITPVEAHSDARHRLAQIHPSAYAFRLYLAQIVASLYRFQAKSR